MTFNQWCGGKKFSTGERLAFEAVWHELDDARVPPARIGIVLSDLFESIERETECNCDRDDW